MASRAIAPALFVTRNSDSAILPDVPGKKPSKPSTKPHIAIVGAGNLARSLAPALRAAGYVIDQIVARGNPASLRRAKTLADKVGGEAIAAGKVQIPSDVVWFCVPDSAIADAATALKNATDWHGKVAIHSSGALTSEELSALRSRGASVASAHPLMTFVRSSQPPLAGVSFGVEGDRKAASVIRRIVSDMRGQFFAVAKADKAAYHAWGMFVSPLLTALLAAGERVAMAAGASKKEAKTRALPILAQTLANYAALGVGESFSGPIARGDVETVKKHLRVLRKMPELHQIYVALALSALRDLPAKNRPALREVLGTATLKN